MRVYQYVILETAAKMFGVHPRTILRAIAEEHNTYWSEDCNNTVQVALDELARAYDTTVQTLRAVAEGRDKFLTPDEAAKKLGIRPRTFRDRLTAGRYKKIGSGGIVRYLRSKIIEDQIATSE